MIVYHCYKPKILQNSKILPKILIQTENTTHPAISIWQCFSDAMITVVVDKADPVVTQSTIIDPGEYHRSVHSS